MLGLVLHTFSLFNSLSGPARTAFSVPNLVDTETGSDNAMPTAHGLRLTEAGAGSHLRMNSNFLSQALLMDFLCLSDLYFRVLLPFI